MYFDYFILTFITLFFQNDFYLVKKMFNVIEIINVSIENHRLLI